MKPVIVTGSKREIADTVSRIDGIVREAIVFVDEPQGANQIGAHNGTVNGNPADLFAEMEPFTVRRGDVDDSRDAIYNRGDVE